VHRDNPNDCGGEEAECASVCLHVISFFSWIVCSFRHRDGRRLPGGVEDGGLGPALEVRREDEEYTALFLTLPSSRIFTRSASK
jgi:hypothetical protein